MARGEMNIQGIPGIDKVKEIARKLSEAVAIVIGCSEEHLSVLEYFYVPIANLVMELSESRVANEPYLPPITLRHLHDLGLGETFYADRFGVLLAPHGKFHFSALSSLEEPILRWTLWVCGVKFGGLSLNYQESPPIKEGSFLASPEKREYLSELLTEAGLGELQIVRFIPITCFELVRDFLEMGLNGDDKCEANVHLLYPEVSLDECYLAYVSARLARGKKVWAKPHGGFYCQGRIRGSFETVELLLSTHFDAPSWVSNSFQSGPQIPHFRYYRTSYIILRNRILRFLRGKGKKRSTLVVFPLLDEHSSRLQLVKDRSWLHIAKELLLALAYVARTSDEEFVLKFHCRDSSERISALLGEIPQSEDLFQLADEKTLFLEFVSLYESVLIVSPFATSLWECLSAGLTPYLYVSDEMEMNAEYKAFLQTNYSGKMLTSGLQYLSIKSEKSKLSTKKMLKAYNISRLCPLLFAQIMRKV